MEGITKQRVLLIIDNLETVDDERVMAFIREVPTPTKIIVTTRHRLDIAYPVRLIGLSQDEALQLIDDECQKRNVTITLEQGDYLYQRTGGIPLAIIWSIAQMGMGYSVETVLFKLGNSQGDIVKFTFQEAIKQLDSNAYTCLLVMGLFATNANREALVQIAGLSTRDGDEAIVTLEELSLLNSNY